MSLVCGLALMFDPGQSYPDVGVTSVRHLRRFARVCLLFGTLWRIRLQMSLLACVIISFPPMLPSGRFPLISKPRTFAPFGPSWKPEPCLKPS